MAASLGRTRYGISVEFSDTDQNSTSSKTYNGFNYISSNPLNIAATASIFVRGGTYEGITYPGLAGLLTSNYIVNNIDVISRNQVNGTVGGE